MKVSKLTFVFALWLASSAASAGYDANMSGNVDVLATYADGDYIYIHLTNQPTSHNGCNPSYFVIMEDVPQNRRNQMYAQLLAAKQSGEAINIGYSANSDCAHGYIHVYRVG